MKALVPKRSFIRRGVSHPRLARLLLACFISAPVMATLASAPRMTSVFSPQGTAQLKVGDTQSALRQKVTLPDSPFTLTTGEDDLLQVQLADGSWVRLAPNSSVTFDPPTNTYHLLSGSVLTFSSLDGRLRETGMDIRGRNNLALLTKDSAGMRIMLLRGIGDFRGQPVSEGHIAAAVGSAGIRDLGPTDMDRFKNEAAILVDLPGSPPLSKLIQPSSTGLPGARESVNATRRHEAAQERAQGSVETFFGKSTAQAEGERSSIAQELPQASISPGASFNPAGDIQQIQEHARLSRPIPGIPTPPLIPPAPAPVGPPPVFTADWSISAAGVITAGALTLTPYFNSGGIAAYTMSSMTVNAPLSLAGVSAFTAAGGKELNFTASGQNANGFSFEFNAAIDVGPLSLTLNSVASVKLAGVTTTGADGIFGAGGAGGNVSVSSSSGDITLTGTVRSKGGTGGKQRGPTPAGAGGAGGAITLTTSRGNLVGGGNEISSIGGNGGADDPGAASSSTEAGGAGGAVTLRSGGTGGVALGIVKSQGGNAGTLLAVKGNTSNGGAGGAITIEGASSGSAAPGDVTVTAAVSIGGNSDADTAVKTSVGDGGSGGVVTIRTSANLTATVRIASKGGDSAAHTDLSQKVPVAGDGGAVAITAGSINDGTLLVSQGGNGGATDGSLPGFGSAPSTTEKAGMGGAGGTVSVMVTGPGAYAPQIQSIGGDAGNTETAAELGGSFSRVFNGVGGKGGDITITQTDPSGTLNFLALGGATIGSQGGNEVIKGSVTSGGVTTDMGGSTSNGKNVNGSIAINVGTTRDLTITGPTAISSVGNGTAAGYDRDANNGLGASIQQNSGNITLTSRDLTIEGGGAIAAGGSSITINSIRNVVIDAAGATTPVIQSVGGTSIGKATSVQLKNGTPSTPAIWNAAGDVIVDVSTGTGGIIDLGTDSILSTSAAKDASGNRTLGNVTLTGSGLTQANGQLYGISANSRAVIASGTITVNKTGPASSTIDVGSAGRQGDPNPPYITISPTLQTPSYSISPQGGNAKITSSPQVIISSQSAITTVNPATGAITSIPILPTPTPFDDAQHGTAQLTAVVSTQPRLVGTDSAPLGAALHNFDSAASGTVAQFIAIKEVSRAGVSVPLPGTSAPGGSTVIVSDPTKVTVNK